MRYKFLITLALLCGISSAGCLAKIDKPRLPQTLNRDKEGIFYSLTDFMADYKDYKTAYKAQNLVEAQHLRNYMANRIKVDIEMNYSAYETQVFFDRANTTVGADFLELGLGVATALSNPARVKTVLSTVATGFQGLRLSYDKNLFREKTTEIIITKMQASRTRVKNQIITGMMNSVEDYSFEQAWADLTVFFYAGTLQGGLQALARDAGKDAADQVTRTEELFRPPTAEELITLESLRDSFTALFKEWDSKKAATTDPDKAAAKAAADKARAALRELNVPFAATDTDQKIFVLLNAQIRETRTQRDKLAKIAAAFRKAGIITE